MAIKTPYDYGAVGDGVADDTIALQTCLNANRRVHLAEGVYRVTSTLVSNLGCHILTGSGQASVIDCCPISGQPGFKVLTSFGSRYADFVITSSNNLMTHALYIDTSGGPSSNVYNCIFENLWLTGHPCVGKYGIYVNSGTNDGYFLNTIRDCTIVGGIYATHWGDSNTIARNTIYGPNNGITLYYTGGSANTTINDNNITADGFSIFLGDSCQNVMITGNQCERINPGQPVAIMVGGSPGKVCNNIRIVGNNINGHNNATFAVIYMYLTTYGFIDGNMITSLCSAPAYRLEGSSSKIGIGPSNVIVAGAGVNLGINNYKITTSAL